MALYHETIISLKGVKIMLKISKELSVKLSIAISILMFVICIAGVCFVPKLTDILIAARNSLEGGNVIGSAGSVIINILAYLVIVIVLLADILLFLLLKRVKTGKVFTPLSVALIRGVSWCCYLLCAVFCGIGIYFHIAFIVAFAAMFLGTCLRVTKNVIEEATEIKSENDLTV